MNITFCGANKEVTGSCSLLEIGNKKILIDCGMFQGSDFNEAKNFAPFIFDAKEIDAVLVTHAHLDHIGRLPKLVKEGFSKKAIYMTRATVELSELVWRDAYEIMEYNHRKFQQPVLFDTSDIATTLDLCQGIDYHQEIEIFPGIKAVWKDAGHIFGSAFIEITLRQAQGKSQTVVFSGDIGNVNEPIVRDTEHLSAVDLLICESTYGDRLHETTKERKNLLLNLFKDNFNKRGTLMIPSFSIERTQELLYELNRLSEHDRTLPKMPIFLDSPLAIRALKVYKKYPDYYDMEAARLHMIGDDFFSFPELKLTETKEQSKTINEMRGSKVVIAGAGMMNGGRILHHAHRYLSDPNSTLFIIGYQAQGTLGRKLFDGEKHVKIFGNDVFVQCKIEAIGALSAHGDQKKLMDWIGGGAALPKKIICNHGEPHASEELARKVTEKFGIEHYIQEFHEKIEI